MANRINPIELFKPLNIPVGYFKNPKPGTVPFMVYYGVGMDSTIADNINYFNVQRFNIELYTLEKRFDLEDKTFMVPYYI